SPDDAGVYSSSYQGDTWIHVSSGITDMHIAGLGFGGAGDTVYAAAPGVVFKTGNSGTSWSQAGTLLTVSPTGLLVNPDDDSMLFYSGLLGNFGLLRSINSGTTWNGVLVEPTTSLATAVLDATRIFYTEDLYRSEDNGTSWSAGLRTGLPAGAELVTIAAAKSSATTVTLYLAVKEPAPPPPTATSTPTETPGGTTPTPTSTVGPIVVPTFPPDVYHVYKATDNGGALSWSLASPAFSTIETLVADSSATTGQTV